MSHHLRQNEHNHNSHMDNDSHNLLACAVHDRRMGTGWDSGWRVNWRNEFFFMEREAEMKKIIVIVVGALVITYLYNMLEIKIEAPNAISGILFFVSLGLYGAVVLDA